MANETLRFDIIANDRASSGFSAAGKSASEAAGDVRKLQDRLVEVSKQSAAARNRRREICDLNHAAPPSNWIASVQV